VPSFFDLVRLFAGLCSVFGLTLNEFLLFLCLFELCSCFEIYSVFPHIFPLQLGIPVLSLVCCCFILALIAQLGCISCFSLFSPLLFTAAHN